MFCILAILSADSATAASKRSAAELAGLPAVDSALKITKVHTPVSFPRLITGLGIGLATAGTSSIKSGLDTVLASYGVAGNSRIGEPSTSITAGFRFQFSERLGIFLDFLNGGTPNANQFIKSAASVGLVVTPFRTRTGSAAVSFGSGITVQKLESHTTYNLPIPSSFGTLEYIRIETHSTLGVPLVAMLELPAAATSRYSMIFTARHVFSPDAKVEENYSPGTNFKVNMSGNYFSIMLNAGIN